MKRLVLLISLLWTLPGAAQELQARLTVVAARVSSQTDRKVFTTLQNSLINFLNNRKWAPELTYTAQEKIRCNFLININEDKGGNVYQASLTVQASRPVFNSTYESPIVNFQDPDFSFKYVEFQPIEFNENRVQGSDPLVANLTAVLAYYVNLIIGMDNASFAQGAGTNYFQKAMNIVNNAPEGRDISGWKPFDGIRNRFRLAENLTDSRFTLVQNAIYAYYRSGLDLMVENEDEARAGIINALNFLNTVNTENPNAMVMPFFFSGKSNELAKLFSRAQTEQKTQARELLAKLDITNAAAYKELR